ncbi:MAG: hypothetical protein RIT26_2061 [Pseudomonadota bacterium]
MTSPDVSTTGLLALAARVREDLALLGLPAQPWLPPRHHEGHVVHDVAVVGAGMAGLTLTAALTHLGIGVHLIDRAPAGQEGPWVTTARMETLRSPKELTGPALGMASLTFRAWFEAQHGRDAWLSLDKIPRVQWAQYLRWYREVLGLQVHNLVQLQALEPQADQVRLTVCNVGEPHAMQTLWARRVVLATGRDGLGGPWLPAWAHDLPPERWVHSSHTWPDDRFAGQRVVIIGAGASAMDGAATALENGAVEARILIRRTQMPRVNKSKGSGNPGMAHGYWALPDDWKWRFRHYIQQQQVPAPKGSTLRVSRHPQAHFHFGVSVQKAEVWGNEVVLHTHQGCIYTDAVIFSTGFRTDWSQRPEFASIAPDVRLWQDRFTHPAGLDDEELSQSPDLGDLFEFQPKVPGRRVGLDRIHCFNYAGALSQGAGAGDIPQISDGAQRLARGLATRFLTEDVSHHFEQLTRYADEELDGSEWTPDFMPNDLIDQAVCPAPQDPMRSLRRERDKVAQASQASLEAVMDARLPGLSLPLRLQAATVVAQHSGAADLATFYRQHPAHQAPVTDTPWPVIERFCRTLAIRPADGDRALLLTLPQAGLDTADVVTLAQLVGLVSYQARVICGLQALSGWQGLGSTHANSPTIPNSTFIHPAQAPKPATALRVNGYTSEELDWKAWLPVLDPAQASDAQRAVLKASHPSAMTSDYYLLLAQQPAILAQRSAAFNAIMYAPGGLSRQERELASTVVSRVNGCVYCAAVHALRFEQLSKRNDVIAQVFQEPRGAGTDAREKAIVEFAIQLTLQPDKLGAAHLAPLANAGLSALEMMDLIHAVAIFAWANRLMLNLGEPVSREVDG